MRFDKFTIKSQELIQNAHALASQHNNQQIEPEHLMSAMLAEEEGIARVTEALHANFKPEFLNRIDDIIIFHNLTPEQTREIVGIQIKRLGARLSEKNINLVISDGAMSFLADKGYDPIYGARPLKRAIQKYIENPLAMEIIKGRIPEGASVTADTENDQIVFHNLSPAENL